MNRFDTEFWNGGLKALILAAERLKKLAIYIVPGFLSIYG